METIKVNMTPCEDIKTIHASQNDNEAREWGFELHNNGEIIDSSSISDQMVFKAYKGGTEEILPTNTSTPTTSPFLGDIKYPQGLLTDQEFTYRQSPTESDGLAKITDIKGNTIVWNQQMDSSRYNTGTYSGVAVTKSTDETYLIANGTATANAYVRLFNVASFPMISGHKYLCVVPNDPDVAYYDDTSPRQYNNQYSSFVFTSNGSPIRPYARINNGVASTNRRISFMMFDLTQMGLDITDPSEITSLFPKPYYDYCQGAMLSFGGRNVKFNQLVENGNFESISGWPIPNGTGSVSDNVLTVTATGSNLQIYRGSTYTLTQGHKILISCWIKSSVAKNDVRLRIAQNSPLAYIQSISKNLNANERTNISGIITAESDTINTRFSIFIPNSANGDVYTVDSFVAFDLTEMFGAGNEPSAEGFKQLFPNDYYEYNVGQYMNLGQPVSLKTVSKNQFNTQIVSPSTTVGTTLTKGDGSIRLQYTGTGRYTGFNFMNPNGGLVSDWANKLLLKKKYRLSFDFGGAEVAWTCGLRTASANSFVGSITMQNQGHYSLTLNLDTMTEDVYISWSRTGNSTNPFDVTVSNIQLELGTTETSYTPFEEKTISLPISQYFPWGMDGVGNAYDELTNSGYVKRIGQITFDGTQNYVASFFDSSQCRAMYSVPDIVPQIAGPTVIDNSLRSNYLMPSSNDQTYNGNAGIHRRTNGAAQIVVSLGTASGITSAEAWNAYLSAHPLTVYYPLATPLENYGVVDLGTLTWTKVGAISMFYAPYETTGQFYTSTVLPNILNNKYAVCNANTMYGNRNGIVTDDVITVNAPFLSSTEQRIIIADTSFTDATALKNALSGVYLLYEKENPQGFTTASLVTENAEIPLSNNDGVLIGKCTEELSENPGFIDAKIKLADADGTCYSNKIQLHVERSPQ